MTFKNRTAALEAFTDAATVQCTQHDGWAYEDWEQQKQAFVAGCQSKLRPGDTVEFTFSVTDQVSAEVTNARGEPRGVAQTTRPLFARQRTGKFRTKGARYTFEFVHTTGGVEISEGLVESLSLTPDGAGLEFENSRNDRMVYSLPTDYA